jgi:hypothetical protein
MIYHLTTSLLAADAFYIYTNKLIIPTSLDALSKLANRNHKLAWGGVLGLGSLFSVLTINKMFGSSDPLGKTWEMFKIFFSQEKVSLALLICLSLGWDRRIILSSIV